ncbi:MAG: hypothetical protein C4334_07270 [Pyrinomonas sp.]|uniref:hypothetical protein n=1 Tax=Pyrinomonas sp. TaxID=2080306 RepID=UPI00331AB3AF
MSAQPRSLFTLEGRFALAQGSERRFECRGGEIFLVFGRTRQHDEIASNPVFTLRRRPSAKKCRVCDIAVLVPAVPPYRYPDGSVARGRAEFRRAEMFDALTLVAMVGLDRKDV